MMGAEGGKGAVGTGNNTISTVLVLNVVLVAATSLPIPCDHMVCVAGRCPAFTASPIHTRIADLAFAGAGKHETAELPSRPCRHIAAFDHAEVEKELPLSPSRGSCSDALSETPVLEVQS